MIAAGAGMVPPSPAPLTPSGLSGFGVSTCSMRDARHVARRRQQIILECGGQRIGVVVVLHPFEQRVADAVGDAALHLAVDDHRVDDVAAVVRHRVVQHGDAAGHRIDLDLDHMRAVAIGRLRRREIGGVLEPRQSVPARTRSPACPAPSAPARRRSGSACCPRGRRRGRPRRRCRSRECRARGTPRRSPASCTLSPAIIAEEPALIACRLAKAPTPCEMVPVSPTLITMSSIRQPSRSATICDSVVRVPWPCVVAPVATATLPFGMMRMVTPSNGPSPVPST